MLYIYLRGGLGNQLFQLCYGMSIASQRGLSVGIVDHYYTIDTSLGDTHRHSYFDTFYKSLAHLRCDGRSGAILRLPQITDEQSDVDASNIVVSGWFQNWNKIRDFVPQFRALFPANRPMKEGTLGIHFRYSDYVSKYAHIYYAQPLDYYIRAVQWISTQMKVRQVLLFCQECDWESFVYPMIQAMTEVDTWTRVQRGSDWEELNVMQTCTGLITTNSTFSVWAGILGDIPHVVHPTKWYCDGRKEQNVIWPPAWKAL